MKRYFAVLRNEVTAKSGVDTQVNVLWPLRPASVLGLHQPHLPGHPRGVQVSVFVIEFPDKILHSWKSRLIQRWQDTGCCSPDSNMPLIQLIWMWRILTLTHLKLWHLKTFFITYTTDRPSNCQRKILPHIETKDPIIETQFFHYKYKVSALVAKIFSRTLYREFQAGTCHEKSSHSAGDGECVHCCSVCLKMKGVVTSHSLPTGVKHGASHCPLRQCIVSTSILKSILKIWKIIN